MIFNSRKKRKVERLWHKAERELENFTIYLESDIELDSEAVLDLVSEAYQDGTDLVEFAQDLSQIVSKDGVQTTAVVVRDGNWLIILSRNPNYELEF